MSTITSSQSAFNQLRNLQTLEVEEFWVLALHANKSLICKELLFRGTVDSCLFHPRDVFRFACLTNASCLIVAHNHPSQDRRPSEADVLLTHRLVSAGQLMSIPVIDHLIITQYGYLSMADCGLLSERSARLQREADGAAAPGAGSAESGSLNGF